MQLDKDTAVQYARRDLAARIDVSEDSIEIVSVTDEEFPDGALGAAQEGEFAAMMITDGWQIELSANGETYEYRGDKFQLRLHNFNGKNYVIEV